VVMQKKSYLESLLGHRLTADPPLRFQNLLDNISRSPRRQHCSKISMRMATHEQTGICISLSFCSTNNPLSFKS
jgi:hypothetical protein